MSTSNPPSAASRAASTRSGRDTVPNSGPMNTAPSAPAPTRIVVVTGAAALDVAAIGADEPPGPGRQRREADAVLAVGLLHAGAPQVVQDDLAEVVARAVAVAGLGDAVDDVAVLVHAQHPVGRDALHGEGAGHPHLAAVLVGLVVQVLVLGPGGDGGVDLLLPGDAQLPPLPVQFLRLLLPRLIRRSRGISHSSHAVSSARFSSSRSGSSFSWYSSQMTSISALLAMSRRVMCGTRS